MNNTTSNQQLCDVICKRNCRLQNHERDLYRVCPSKLSKRELENLYFALLENNLELKKTLHSQHDKIKVLSTKLQRMTVVQRQAAGKEKDCCSSKVLVNEQKEIIADLKNANEQMADRVRQLNMRLCSAKQFLRRSPAQAKCPRCGACPVFGTKNSSMSAIGTKPSQASVKTTAASYQYIPVDASEGPKISTQDVATETDQDVNESMEKPCNENKCRSVMEELKQKIVNLQEELSKSHDEYSTRICKLEGDVSGLRRENLEARAGAAASDHALRRNVKITDDLTTRLRDTEGRANDLKMQLSIEKRKVKELETALKLAKSSSQTAILMDKINTPEPKPLPATEASGSVSSYYSVRQEEDAPSPTCLCKPDMLSPATAILKESGKFPKSDDSGCTDLNKSSDADDSRASYMERLNQEMLKKISDLQMQVDDFRIKAAGETAKIEIRDSSDMDYCDNERQMTVITITDPNAVLEVQELGPKRQDSFIEKDIDTSTPIKNSEVPSTSNKTGVVEVITWDDLDRSVDLGTTIKRPSSEQKSPSEPKRDENNKYQIPGPIGTSFQTYNDKKKRLKNSNNIKKDTSSNETKEDKGDLKDKGVKINKNSNIDVSNKQASDKAKSDIKTDANTSVKQNETPLKTVESPKARNQKLKTVDPKKTQVVGSNITSPKVSSVTESKISDSKAASITGSKIVDSKAASVTGSKIVDPKATAVTGPEIVDPKVTAVTGSIIVDPKATLVTGITIVDPKSEQLTGLKIEDPKTLPTALKIVDPKDTPSTQLSITDQKKEQASDDDDLIAVLGNFKKNPTSITPTSLAKENEIELDDKVQTKAKTLVKEFMEIKESTSSDVGSNNATTTRQAIDSESAKNKFVSAQTDQTANMYVDGRTEQFEQCLSRATLCRCPRSIRREINVFRTCSGTRRFYTTEASQTFRQCECLQQSGIPVEVAQCPSPTAKTVPLSTVTPTTVSMSAVSPTMSPAVSIKEPKTAQSTSPLALEPTVEASIPPTVGTVQSTVPCRDSITYTVKPDRRDSATFTALPPRRDSATFTKSEPEKCKCERATSPANTDRDVSSLSDLPPEKYNGSPRGTPPASPRDAYSPGEERAASTCTETDSRTNDYGPLSDGELPTHATLARARKLSFGEQPSYARSAPRSSEVNMEATLNAISEELAHCRKLLAAARDHEGPANAFQRAGPGGTPVGGSVYPPGGPERVHRLHAAAAARRLSASDAHTAVFTLHIGTLVLSDEAMLSSRDKSLVLAWQFYDQAVAMTRMRAGRVVLFDFSTEYDVGLNDDFLSYMKQEEMLLTICNINNQNEVFASCSLPLRDVLINANRRVDMSLALMAGPAFRSWGEGRAARADPLVAGDELGVLDLWCCLRAPPRDNQPAPAAFPRNPAAETTDKDLTRSESRTNMLSDDEEQDTRAAQETVLGPQLHRNRTFRAEMWSEKPPHSGRGWSFDRSPTLPDFLAPWNPDTSEITENTRKLSKNSTQTQKSTSTLERSVDGRWSSPPRRSSEMIENQVPANIRSTAEMRQALERNVQTMCRSPKMDDELSVAQSSICSLRNAAEKHRKRKLNTTKLSTSRVPEGLQDMLIQERKLSMVAAAAAKGSNVRKKRVPFVQNSQDTDQDVQAKYNNIGQFIGLNKILEQSKKTVTYTDAAEPIPAVESGETQGMSEGGQGDQSIDITILWLALNEECEAMQDPEVSRLYVAYSFLGRRGADLETPISLPKPKHYAEKCYFNFKKTFNLHDADLPLLGHLSRCRAGRSAADPRDCLVFTVVSEPPEDPLGLAACREIGHAYLYLGDILAYSAGGAGYTEVVAVRARAGGVCGVLAVRLAGLRVLRRALSLQHALRDLPRIL